MLQLWFETTTIINCRRRVDCLALARVVAVPLQPRRKNRTCHAFALKLKKTLKLIRLLPVLLTTTTTHSQWQPTSPSTQAT